MSETFTKTTKILKKIKRGQKRKGTLGERDIVNSFWEKNIPAIRVAGSGSMRHPSPDIIAGNSQRKFVIECKVITNSSIYIPKMEIEELQEFARLFGAESFIAVKFDKSDWKFVLLEDLRETENCFTINEELISLRGLLFEDIIGVL